jgi:hypothetical protein
MWNGKLSQFTCLAQALNTCTRVFIKIMKCAFSDLPKKGIVALRILTIPYRDCKENIRDTVDLIDSLGLTIHPVKSIITPTQEIQYMSFILNLREITVQLTRE